MMLPVQANKAVKKVGNPEAKKQGPLRRERYVPIQLSACFPVYLFPYLLIYVLPSHGASRFKSRGKRVASRMLSSPSSCIRKRSRPIAQPPCGGMPCLNASK